MECQIVSDSKTNDEHSDSETEEIDLTSFTSDKVLELNYKGLTKLPLQLTQGGEFIHVTHLYLKRNRLTKLPENIKLLQNLMVLSSSVLAVSKSLKTSSSEHSYMMCLMVSSSSSHSWHRGLSLSLNLCRYLHSNELSSLPESIGELQLLQVLDVGANYLTSLPESIGRLTVLYQLKFAFNSITYLPKSIGRLKHLYSLEAMNNELRSLPVELFDCQRLEILMVDANKLTTIPRQLRNLDNLRHLSATGNDIIMLPFGHGRYTNLGSVLVDGNCHLSVLPIDISEKHVGFYRCDTLPLSTLPDSVLSSLCLVTVQHSEASKKTIPLPWEIRTQGNLTDTCVPTLLELCLRATYEQRYEPVIGNPKLFKDDIPCIFLPLLECPTAFCYHCCCAVFIMAYPIIYQTKIADNVVYVLVLCCSVKCVRQTIVHFNKPFVYPSLENLSLAVD